MAALSQITISSRLYETRKPFDTGGFGIDLRGCNGPEPSNLMKSHPLLEVVISPTLALPGVSRKMSSIIQLRRIRLQYQASQYHLKTTQDRAPRASTITLRLIWWLCRGYWRHMTTIFQDHLKRGLGFAWPKSALETCLQRISNLLVDTQNPNFGRADRSCITHWKFFQDFSVAQSSRKHGWESGFRPP